MARNIGSNRNIGSGGSRGRFVNSLDELREAPAALVQPSSGAFGRVELGAIAHNIEFRGSEEYTRQQQELLRQAQAQTQAPTSILKRGKHHKEDRKVDKKTGIQFTDDNREFERADTFGGARSGFVYKRGDHGLGYYAEKTRDEKPKGCCAIA